MVISQTLKAPDAARVNKPKGIAAIRKVKKANKDISAIIDARVRAKKPKTAVDRKKERQKAIVEAEKRNPAFRTAVLAALTRLVGQ